MLKQVLTKKTSIVSLLVAIVFILSQTAIFAADGIKKRSEIPDQYKWNLETMYKSTADWNTDFHKIKDSYIPKISSYKGKLNKPGTVLECLQLRDEVAKLMEKVYVYASLKLDENQADNGVSEMQAESDTLNSQVSESMAFIEPELLSQPETTIKSFISNPALSDYKRMLLSLLEQKEHTLSKGEEELLAKASLMASSPNDIYNKLKQADLTFNDITDENGETIKVTNSNYSSLLDGKNRDTRRKAFESIYSSYDKFKNTFSSTLYAEVKKNVFYARARKYNSALEAALASEDIPTGVYDNLVKSVNNNVGYLHKYVNLRKKVLGVDKVHLYDMYVSLIKGYEANIPYEQGQKLVLEGLKPLGQEYASTVKKGFDSRWIDVFENENKASGAYSWGTYDTNPYILMNYDNSVDAVLTLAHELGHSLNSYYTHKSQKYVNSGIPIFTAEVASTTNEFLMLDYMMKNAKSDDEKLYLLNNMIENIRGTVYTQTMYSEFEQAIHDKVEKGEALSAKTLKELWGSLMAKYYGENFETDDLATLWWARIPHLYMNFYVYKYATSMSASNQLYKNIVEGKSGAVDKYLTFLKAGSSDSPIAVLKAAGVDMTSPEPVDNLLAEFGKLVDQMEQILKKQGKIQ